MLLLWCPSRRVTEREREGMRALLKQTTRQGISICHAPHRHKQHAPDMSPCASAMPPAGPTRLDAKRMSCAQFGGGRAGWGQAGR